MSDDPLDLNAPKRLPARPLRKYAVFVDGEPVLAYAQPYTKAQVAKLYPAALATEYEPREMKDADTGKWFIPKEEERFRGMSNFEVGVQRTVERFADGDMEAGREILDRILGKPKQQTENLNVNMTLQEMLDAMGRQEVVVTNEQVVLDAEVTEPVSTFMDAVMTKPKRTIDPGI